MTGLGKVLLRAAWLFAVVILLPGCGRSPAPPPAPLDAQATGYYCGMIVIDHPGPKAQIWVAGRSTPLWFTSVNDGFAYLQSGEREGRLLAFYVQDMARANSWEKPGPDAWIAAGDAFYVWGSDRKGGMGAPALVPFADRAAAEAFIARHGGRILRFAEARRLPLLGAGAPAPSDAAAEMPGLDGDKEHDGEPSSR